VTALASRANWACCRQLEREIAELSASTHPEITLPQLGETCCLSDLGRIASRSNGMHPLPRIATAGPHFGAALLDGNAMNGRVQYNPVDGNYRVYWQGRLMRPTFSNRLAALRYLCALRSGLSKPDFAQHTREPKNKKPV
jgi:hypothetical protein